MVPSTRAKYSVLTRWISCRMAEKEGMCKNNRRAYGGARFARPTKMYLKSLVALCVACLQAARHVTPEGRNWPEYFYTMLFSLEYVHEVSSIGLQREAIGGGSLWPKGRTSLWLKGPVPSNRHDAHRAERASSAKDLSERVSSPRWAPLFC